MRVFCFFFFLSLFSPSKKFDKYCRQCLSPVWRAGFVLHLFHPSLILYHVPLGSCKRQTPDGVRNTGRVLEPGSREEGGGKEWDWARAPAEGQATRIGSQPPSWRGPGTRQKHPDSASSAPSLYGAALKACGLFQKRRWSLRPLTAGGESLTALLLDQQVSIAGRGSSPPHTS